MRYPPDDTADQPASRRRGHPGSGPVRQAASDGSVFVPGYDKRREPGPDTADSGGPGSPPWHGSAAGRGPVRGYPPGPGQPPPMYPPGQFAAWNRGPGRASGVQPGPSGLASTSPGQSGASGREAQDSRAATGGAASNPGFP